MYSSREDIDKKIKKHSGIALNTKNRVCLKALKAFPINNMPEPGNPALVKTSSDSSKPAPRVRFNSARSTTSTSSSSSDRPLFAFGSRINPSPQAKARKPRLDQENRPPGSVAEAASQRRSAVQASSDYMLSRPLARSTSRPISHVVPIVNKPLVRKLSVHRPTSGMASSSDKPLVRKLSVNRPTSGMSSSSDKPLVRKSSVNRSTSGMASSSDKPLVRKSSVNRPTSGMSSSSDKPMVRKLSVNRPATASSSAKPLQKRPTSSMVSTYNKPLVRKSSVNRLTASTASSANKQTLQRKSSMNRPAKYEVSAGSVVADKKKKPERTIYAVPIIMRPPYKAAKPTTTTTTTAAAVVKTHNTAHLAAKTTIKPAVPASTSRPMNKTTGRPANTAAVKGEKTLRPNPALVKRAAAAAAASTTTATTAVTAVVEHVQPVAEPVQPVAEPVQPVKGHVQPVEGHVQPVEGHVQPVEGHVQPVEGHVQTVPVPADTEARANSVTSVVEQLSNVVISGEGNDSTAPTKSDVCDEPEKPQQSESNEKKPDLEEEDAANAKILNNKVNDSSRFKAMELKSFEVGKSLGSGRSGHVYLARIKSNGFLCAIKVIYKNSLNNKQAKDQLFREIEIQYILRHPHILRLYTYFEDDFRVFIVLEYAPKGELYKYLKEFTKFTERQSATYIKQLASALIYCKANNVIHRDLKPENILVDNRGNLKIADFGWSVQSFEESRQTLCGTIDYLPPEMVMGNPYNDAVDRWSLGILLYEFLVGTAPFLAEGNEETFKRIACIDLKIPYFVSDEATEVISKLLKYEPSERMTLDDLIKHPWVNKED